MPNVLRASLMLAVLAGAHLAQAAESELHPSLALSQEFTDNIFETRANRISDYISRALPGVVVKYKAPAFSGDLNYVFDYRHYARNSHKDEIAHALSAKANLTAVENLLFLDASDEFQRVSLDATRDVSRESLFVNQADRNVMTVSPYLKFRPIERITVKNGYTFMDTRYFSSAAIDKINHIGIVETAYEVSKQLSLTADYTYTREITDVDRLNQHRALGGFRYEYADTSFVFAQAGNAWTRYDAGQRLSSIIWNVGITHVFDTVTATVTTGVRNTEDPLRNILEESFVSGTIEKRFTKGTLSLTPQYSEFVLTKTDALQTKKYGATLRGQYEFITDLNGSLGITAEKYDQQLLGSYTRRFQVDSALSYLLATQLSVSLAYVYTNYYSPGIETDNRHINRIMIEIKKTF